MDTCIFCKADLDRHCQSATCTWRLCGTCETTYALPRRRALRRGVRVPWPYTLPDSA